VDRVGRACSYVTSRPTTLQELASTGGGVRGYGAGFHPIVPNPQTTMGLYSPVSTGWQMKAGSDASGHRVNHRRLFGSNENVHRVNHRRLFVAYVPVCDAI
jgi:hypothetical protein